MEYALLRSLRALGPGLMLLSYVDLFLMCVLNRHAYFWDLDSAKLFLIGYVVGGVLGVFSGRIHRDRYAFEGVNESTLAELQKFVPEVSGKSWREISPCFYALIDNDKSLEQKSKGMYFNGFIVTMSFDAIWLSLFASITGGVVALWKNEWWFLTASATSLAIAYLIWRAAVHRHCELAIAQVNVIKKRYAISFRDCVVADTKIQKPQF
jgi:hypothetical protein